MPFERVVESEALAASNSDLDPKADHLVVQIGDLRPPLVADFTKRSVSFTCIVCYPIRTTALSQAAHVRTSKVLSVVFLSARLMPA